MADVRQRANEALRSAVRFGGTLDWDVVVPTLEAEGLAVVDAAEHDDDRLAALHQRSAELVRALPLSLDVERALIAARRVVDRPTGECAVALMQTLRESLAAIAPHHVYDMRTDTSRPLDIGQDYPAASGTTAPGAHASSERTPDDPLGGCVPGGEGSERVCLEHGPTPTENERCTTCGAATLSEKASRRLSAKQARAILREYPDADLSAFDVDGDVEAMAVEETAKSIAKLAAKADRGEGCRCLCHTIGYPHIGPSAADPCCAVAHDAAEKGEG